MKSVKYRKIGIWNITPNWLTKVRQKKSFTYLKSIENVEIHQKSIERFAAYYEALEFHIKI